MDVANPANVLLSDADARVLKVLAGTSSLLTGREVARLSGGVQSTVQRSLHRLAEHGLLHSREIGAGAALVYTLNTEHLAYDAIPALINMRLNLVDRIRQHMAEWAIAPLHASLFGSAARGDGSTESDIDLFVLQPQESHGSGAWAAQTDSLSQSIRNWSGNHASILDLAESQVARLCAERPSLVDELRRDAIHVIGAPLTSVLQAAKA